jgi:NADH-quinone oxidoreductase subunit F
MLQDQDRIFTNLYGMHDRSIRGRPKKPAATGTAPGS